MQDRFISVIIPTAGSGVRMNARMNKNFMLLKNRPILLYALTVFDKCSEVDEIIIVCKADEKDSVDEMLHSYKFTKNIKIIPGGETRQQSVYNGLCAADKKCGYVVIHDGARPFVTGKMIKNTIIAAIKYGASCTAVMAKDTYVLSKNNKIYGLLDRNELYTIQTPQAFRYDLIKSAHESAVRNNLSATDDTSLVKKIGADVILTEGSYENIKITTSEDLILAEMILNKK